jgi:fumarate hydratase, class II
VVEVGPPDAPRVLDVPVGIDASGERIEVDTMGSVAVPADRYWGAGTQRALQHFAVGDDRMPTALCRVYGHVKKAAALVNARAGVLPGWKADLIARVCEEVVDGRLDEHFPLHVWQSGSGTQTNMNVNEVIANRCIQLVGGVLGSKTPIHPNDDVNLSQSSNDTFPTVMHLVTLLEITLRLVPEVSSLRDAVASKAHQWADVVKVGRTHLQDAVPLTVGQEWSGYAEQITQALARLTATIPALCEIAAGGTAVGTGLNAPAGFGDQIAAELSSLTGLPLVTAPNKFAALGGLDAMVAASAGLRALAVPLMKIANDIRWAASGPGSGLGELVLPANEPGSSIMPGKVNPTQCEVMVMVCTQVLADDTAVAFAGAQGNFELNTMRPLVISNVLRSAKNLTDSARLMRIWCIEGIELNRERIASNVDRSLMLVTALTPALGYDAAAAIAHRAHRDGITLREAALASGVVSAEDFDRLTDPRAMTTSLPGGADSATSKEPNGLGRWESEGGAPPVD